MPPQISDDQLGHALLQSVKDGSYPEDETIISAELPSSALAGLSELIEVARADVKVEHIVEIIKGFWLRWRI